jgi:hypothetical protein
VKYLGYLLILAAFVAGYVGFHPIGILILAALSTLIYASARRKALKSQPLAPDQNMIFEGAFLIAGQILIMFMVYILGWFFGNLGTPTGMFGRTMVAFVVIGAIGTALGLVGRSK